VHTRYCAARHQFASNKGCIFIPVDLKWDGKSYSGTFLVDRFLPSRCDWSFGGLSSSLPSKDTPVIYTEHALNPSPDNETTDRTADIWCGIDPATQQPRVIVCSNLSYFARHSDHLPSAWTMSVAARKSKTDDILFITSSARSIELRYHDFDAESRDASDINK
jgi:hypothetical protein